jgi:hypothetical protein
MLLKYQRKLIYLNLLFLSIYVFLTSFIYLDISSKVLKQYPFLQNRQILNYFGVAFVLWLFFLFYKNPKSHSDAKDEIEINTYIFVTLVFIFFEYTFLNSFKSSTVLYLGFLFLTFLLIAYDHQSIKKINVSNNLTLIILSLVFVCFDVNYSADVLSNTFSYTNFQRTGDYEQYLFIGKFIITDGYLVLYKLITIAVFSLTIIYWNKIKQLKLIKNKTSFYLILLIVFCESTITNFTQNDYYHNAFTFNEIIGLFNDKNPLINFSSTYNNLFPYIYRFLFGEISIYNISIFISIISIFSIILTLLIIHSKERDYSKNDFPIYFIGLMISSTLLSRPHYSLRLLPILFVIYVLSKTNYKINKSYNFLYIFLISICVINNFSFGVPFLLAFIVTNLIIDFYAKKEIGLIIKNNLITFIFLFINIFILYIVYDKSFFQNLISQTLTYGSVFLEVFVEKKFSLHFFFFPILFYNLSRILKTLNSKNLYQNKLSILLTIYSIGIIPYYINIQEIYHALPIILFTFFAVVLNKEKLSLNIFYIFIVVGVLLFPRIFIGFSEIYYEISSNNEKVKIIDSDDYETEFFKNEIKELDSLIKTNDLSDVGYLLNLNNFLELYIEIDNDTIENVPTPYTFNLICNSDKFSKNKYLMYSKSAEYFKAYISKYSCDKNIVFSKLRNSHFTLFEITKS